jgi:hypothetical protein
MRNLAPEGRHCFGAICVKGNAQEPRYEINMRHENGSLRVPFSANCAKTIPAYRRDIYRRFYRFIQFHARRTTPPLRGLNFRS